MLRVATGRARARNRERKGGRARRHARLQFSADRPSWPHLSVFHAVVRRPLHLGRGPAQRFLRSGAAERRRGAVGFERAWIDRPGSDSARPDAGDRGLGAGAGIDADRKSAAPPGVPQRGRDRDRANRGTRRGLCVAVRESADGGGGISMHRRDSLRLGVGKFQVVEAAARRHLSGAVVGAGVRRHVVGELARRRGRPPPARGRVATRT